MNGSIAGLSFHQIFGIQNKQLAFIRQKKKLQVFAVKSDMFSIRIFNFKNSPVKFGRTTLLLKILNVYPIRLRFILVNFRASASPLYKRLTEKRFSKTTIATILREYVLK